VQSHPASDITSYGSGFMKRAILPLFFILTASAASASPIGTWRVADGSGEVQIRHCGRNTLCGAAHGTTVLSNMRQTGPNSWVGTIIDVRGGGDKYDGTISLESESALKIHGCVQGGGFCGDQTWTRVR
jgi:uncharacterized protein (DUF2147 family)